jgi:hypothetical protein
MKVFITMHLSLASASPAEICQEQLRENQVPVACFAHFAGAVFGSSPHQDLLEILNRRCVAAVRRMHRIAAVLELVHHPALSTQCRSAVEGQLQKLRYRHEDVHPWEVVESFTRTE